MQIMMLFMVAPVLWLAMMALNWTAITLCLVMNMGTGVLQGNVKVSEVYEKLYLHRSDLSLLED